MRERVNVLSLLDFELDCIDSSADVFCMRTQIALTPLEVAVILYYIQRSSLLGGNESSEAGPSGRSAYEHMRDVS